jgi:murein L,D-transpeptidase YcbB/YkuD
MKRIVTVFVCVFFAALISGCATVKDIKSIRQMNTRLDNLENQLKERESFEESIKESQQKIEQAVMEQALLNKALMEKSKDLMQMAEAEKGKSEDLLKKLEVEKTEVRIPTSEEIQTALKNAGFYTGEIDGKIGSQTKEAIMNFQKENNLNPDGAVGSKTWSILCKYLKEKAQKIK